MVWKLPRVQYRKVNAYLEALDGVYGISDAKTGAEFEELVWLIEEEVFADAYAGINASENFSA